MTVIVVLILLSNLLTYDGNFFQLWFAIQTHLILNEWLPLSYYEMLSYDSFQVILLSHMSP